MTKKRLAARKTETHYEIDQSGKIEQTNKDTVIAYSNGSQYAVVIPRRLKRRLQEVFRLHGFTSLFIYYLFSVGIFYLLQSLKQKSSVIVDTEYPGNERLILQFVKMLLEANRVPTHDVTFGRIGNRPPAHYAAKDVFDKKKKPDRVLQIVDFIRALKKTDGRLRECLSTLVDAQARPYTKRLPRRSRKVK